MDPTKYEELVSKVAKQMTNVPELVHLSNVKLGRDNKWQGVSGFRHQIDVSLENDKHILLVECKRWNYNVTALVFLTLWARVMDISKAPVSKGRQVRGAIVTSRGFQTGVYKLAKYYKEQVSLFYVTTDEKFEIKSHTHFIGPTSIPSSEKIGDHTVIQLPPSR